jgi:succinylglutamic semialdehyde dehydrogenase
MTKDIGLSTKETNMKTNRIVRGNYIEGQFLKVTDPNGEVKSANPGDLEQGEVPFPFSFEHIHEAVSAAKRGFISWRRIQASDRYAAVRRYRDLLQTRAADLSRVISTEVGKPLWESKSEVAETISIIDDFLSVGSQTTQELQVPSASPSAQGVVRFLPRGVMAVIGPASMPVYTAHTHFIPALIHGNTVVLKASPHAPFTGQFLAEIMHEAGLPAGVINVLHGSSEVARRLVAHPDVNGIFFTGSHESGMQIKKQVVSDFEKVIILDMGGKNGLVVWDDCDYKKTVQEALLSAFLTTGQRCTSADRILVHDKIFDRFLSDFHALAKKCKIGFGLVDENEPFMGPLISETALEHYLRYQGIAVREGCEEIMRGKLLEREQRGHYVSPSIHWVKKADPKSVYQRSEIFGPNVAFHRVKDLDETAEILNQTQYGLVASVYTKTREHYLRLVDDVQVSLLHWNRPTTEVSYRLPYGGIKKSGNARPMGSYAGLQCTYPVSSLEHVDNPQAPELPLQLPRWEENL